MAGIGHRGFMGRKKGGLSCGSPPPGFRFLHDEISGGLLAASKIQCKASYNCEPVVNIGTASSVTGTRYPLTNGVLDLSAIQADYPGVTEARFYDQTDFPYGVLSGSASGWTGSNLTKGGLCITKSFTAISNTVPLTVVIVANGLDADLGGNYHIMNGQLNIRLQYSSNDLIFQLNGGTFTRQTYSGTRTSGLKLMVATYDGSQNRSGLRLYINDMTTPLSGTPGGNSASVSAATYSSLAFSTVDTLIEDTHVFTGVEADLSQRTAIKEILEQYYTFS